MTPFGPFGSWFGKYMGWWFGFRRLVGVGYQKAVSLSVNIARRMGIDLER